MSGTDWTRTTNLQLYKPIYDQDAENWGTHLNWNADVIDGMFGAGSSAPWLPLAGGTMSGGLMVTATGGNTARSVQDRAADVVNVLDYGARGNTIGLSGGAITAGTSAFTCAGAAFTSADVGKVIIVHGCGTAGAPQQGTINAVTSGTALTVSFTAVTTVTSANFHYGADDTAAITSAITAARNTAKAVHFPARTYWLATQNAAISLTRVALIGEGTVANFFPYTGGSVLFIGNSTTAAFNGVAGTTVRNMAFYYPGIDGGPTTPAVYPPLFEADAASAGEANNWLESVRVLNAYRVFHVTTAGSLARTFISNCLMYGVDAVFYMQSGFADTVQVTNCYFGPGAFGAEATNAPANLQTYTCANGAVFRLSLTGNYTYGDGLSWLGGLVGSYRYAIQVTAGVLDVSVISGVNFDGVGSVLDVTGSARVVTTTFAGGEMWCNNPRDGSQTPNAFNLNTSGACDIEISGVYVANALGHFFWDAQGTLSSLVLSACSINHWGRSTTAGTYYGVGCPVGQPNATITISGNKFDGDRTGVTSTVVAVEPAGGTVAIAGNTFRNCTRPILVIGSSGAVAVSGNASVGSGGAPYDTSTGALAVRWGRDNVWDIAQVGRSPTLSGAGTGASLVAGSTDLRGGIVCGTSATTAVTFNFAANLPAAPSCCNLTCSKATVQVAAETVVYNGVVIRCSADPSGSTIYYNVIP